MFSPVEWRELAESPQLDERTVALAKRWLCDASPLGEWPGITFPCDVKWVWVPLKSTSDLVEQWYQ